MVLIIASGAKGGWLMAEPRVLADTLLSMSEGPGDSRGPALTSH
jgi:hypothetical protein